MLSRKDLNWNWKSFLAAVVIAALINIFASAAAGTKPAKNIFWTVWWIYLTIEAWKYWKWKALLPYPIFLITSTITAMVMVDAGVEYRGWTDVIIRGALNIGGLIIFGWLLGKSQMIRVGNVTASNIPAREKGKAEAGKSVDYDVYEDRGPGIMVAKNILHSENTTKEPQSGGIGSLTQGEAFYEQAFHELESENKKIGLWAKVFAEAQGNESLAKANYLKIRAGQLADEYKQTLASIESARTFTSPTLKAKFILIPSGTFMMGSPANEDGRGNDETEHQVTISKPFYMQTTPLTQSQWGIVMVDNPSNFTKWFTTQHHYPVEQVSWNDVQKFIWELNQLEGTDRYRLPTEAQWEYAARAGTTTRFYTGNSEEGLSRVGWCSSNAGGGTSQVAQKAPNAWGLYDMHGNVYEWVQDWKGDYPNSSVTDPEGPPSGRVRVNRGGSWYSNAGFCRSAKRSSNDPDERDNRLGFRLLRTF
jgi:formylglycine-generating enzyme required for sulfatase activity